MGEKDFFRADQLKILQCSWTETLVLVLFINMKELIRLSNWPRLWVMGQGWGRGRLFFQDVKAGLCSHTIAGPSAQWGRMLPALSSGLGPHLWAPTAAGTAPLLVCVLHCPHQTSRSEMKLLRISRWATACMGCLWEQELGSLHVVPTHEAALGSGQAALGEIKAQAVPWSKGRRQYCLPVALLAASRCSNPHKNLNVDSGVWQ